MTVGDLMKVVSPEQWITIFHYNRCVFIAGLRTGICLNKDLLMLNVIEIQCSYDKGNALYIMDDSPCGGGVNGAQNV